MTTLRDRIRGYWVCDDYPETPDWYDPPRWVPLLGAGIVAATGFLATAPLAGLLLVGVAYLGIKSPLAVLLGLVILYPASNKLAHYLGGPLADHLLGVPREVAP